MCGRYSPLTEDEIIKIREIIREVSLRLANDNVTINPLQEEIYPADFAPVITDDGDDAVSFENIQWGFKKWDGKGVIINARVETIEIKSMFKGLLHAGRCVVPANEYFEWARRGNKKIKHFVKDADGNFLFMAGLYKNTPDGKNYVIITKEAYGPAAEIHDRMPVVLKADQIELWLSGKLSPEDIMALEFNALVQPVGIKTKKTPTDMHEQMSLMDVPD